ncbi:MAG: hypothetical protein FWH04_07330 [Oscillospiraceae bacterium]|nr:hypothetical protein [Oscillospiraceae bacterium]
MELCAALARERLEALGLTIEGQDEVNLGLFVKRAVNGLLSDCAIDELPEVLLPIVADRAAGRFLREWSIRKQGVEELGNENLVKQIQEGDTSVTYAVGHEVEPALDKLVEELLNSGQEIIANCRRLRW